MVRSKKNILLSGLIAVGAFFAVSPMVYALPAEAVVAQVVETEPSVKAEPGCIVFYVPGDKAVKFSIYSITGQVIKVVTASPVTTVIEMSLGYYIVKCDNRSTQVVVR